jgi:S1-C subfamily serine protease
MLYRLTKVVVVFASLLVILNSSHAQDASLDIERLERATVFILQANNVGNELIVTCAGTGTIVSRDGLVLANAHDTVQSSTCPGETLIIALSVRLDEPPIAQYRAEIAQSDPGLDLALLRITRELDGRLIDSSALSLPFVELADSSTVSLDETVTVVGYPGIGNDPVSVVRGTVNGFVVEPRGSDAAWMKTSAVIPGMMSGGGAYNRLGQLIGIPTTTPLSTSSTCLPIQDTNRDRLVNSDDVCIPIGGVINSLRPSNFARPLLRGASLGLQVKDLVSNTILTPLESSSAPVFKRLFFSPAVNEAGMPASVIRTLPAGTNSLYLFFDYENFTPETIYELRVTTNGIPNPTFSLAPVRWSGGSRGQWYIGSSGQPWPNGIYEFTLFANGVAAPTARLVIGESDTSAPSFSDIVFGLLDLRGNPLGNGYVLPSGNTASARFIFRNMENGLDWTAIWYLNGTEFTRTNAVWNEGTDGSTTTSIESQTGLPPGSYRLELYVTNRLLATSDFTIAGAQQGALPEVFANLRFTTANTPEEALTAVSISNFSEQVPTLYALFDWQQIAPGTLWTIRWLVDGEQFYERTIPWSAPDSGKNYLSVLSSSGAVPDGTYTIEILLNNLLLASAQAQVGIGQLPIDRFAQASGVLMRGQIRDANTNLGIPGVTVILLNEEFSVSDFDWNNNKVFALATTDTNGNFQVDRPLRYSTKDQPVAYSAIIIANGYLPITADGIEVTTATANPLSTILYLSKD